MRDYERRAVADAAYEAYRRGGNYDDAWDRAQDAVLRGHPLDRFEAEEMAHHAAMQRPVPDGCPECGGGIDYPCQCEAYG
jgi:hypothetical protein